MRALWSGPHAEFHGNFVDFDPATCSPRPINGDIPIIVGGDSEAALRRAVKIADGYFPGEGDAEALGKLLRRLELTAEANDRDPKTIEISAIFGAQMMDPANGVEQMASIGVDRIMVPAFFFAGPEGLDNLRKFAEQIMPVAREMTEAG